MNNITIYTRKDPFCMHCEQAKSMLQYYGIDYKDIVIGEDISKFQFKSKYPFIDTVPAIFFDETYIGGAQELSERVWEISGNDKGTLYG
tara:strand:+ start:335 stop:601 length:267 start_codon:yes stop_codon:yes gene_type:complete